MTTTTSHAHRIQVGKRLHGDKGDAIFVLTLDKETVTLNPGATWAQADHHKWVMRGLIEAPHRFIVAADGSIEINSETIHIHDPEAIAKLEVEINRRHSATGTDAAATGVAVKSAAAPPPDPRRFRVRLDHFDHLMIEWGHGTDRDETGLRGLGTLIANGLMRKPEHYRVDPMQRSIEIDGVTYQCNEAGAKQLEEALNSRYAPRTDGASAPAIEVRENRAASTGFDLHFRTSHAGVMHDLKGHLCQELLEQLQDPAHSELIQPGIHIFLAPPNLLIRRRRPDLGEEKIPELPDVNLHRLTAAQLQQILNHPIVRRNAAASVASTATAITPTAGLGELRVVRHPEDKRLFWLECYATSGELQGTKALTHHNIADLQQAGCFHPHLEISLTLDHQRLTIHDRPTGREEAFTLDPVKTPDEVLGEVGSALTQSLRQSAFGAGEMPMPVPAPNVPAEADSAEFGGAVLPPREDELAPTIRDTLPRFAEPPPALDPAIVALFPESDALTINLAVFRRLSEHLGIPAQEVCLSLPFVFENRRFEIINFERQEITDLMELRGTDFYGFYLSHVSEKKVMLVYACNGMHLEFGPEKCILQATIKSEAEESTGQVLLGLAQNRQNEFVFVVDPEFKKWIAPREMPYTDENLQFLTVEDIATAPDNYSLIWPLRLAR